jgi:pyruvyltransferase
MAYKVWWMHGASTHNFGDVLTPLIFNHFSIDFEYSKEGYDTISVGSIANKAVDGCQVLGSGMAWKDLRLNPKAVWKFVRGPLTRDAIINSGGSCPEIYGDPALLLPALCGESKKKYDIGIIPHYKEYGFIKNKYPNHFVINLNNKNPKEVVKQITQCRTIMSSSLHGLICAHAFGIPAAWVKFSDIIIGDGTKYKDYFLSLGLEAEPSSLEDPIFKVGSLDTDKLVEIFKSLK